MSSMLSRTASNLYWIGRYMERAEFTTRLVEATLRLSSLTTSAAAVRSALESALIVAGAANAFRSTGENLTAFSVSRYLMLAADNPNSVRSCLASARDNARAARNAITGETWEAINRAWLDIAGRTSPGGSHTKMSLVDAVTASNRGFEGALSRMLRRESYWFIRLGSVIERGDNTARLLDVKYYLLLPEGERVGGILDRDQWTTILQTVSARNAYRLLYREGLKPWLVADLLIFRRELPRSIGCSCVETLELLAELGGSTGRQGVADRLARQREAQLARRNIEDVFRSGLHEFLQLYISDNAALNQAIAQQFRFD
jgi:uncharacterized alpha-E superfamily protein